MATGCRRIGSQVTKSRGISTCYFFFCLSFRYLFIPLSTSLKKTDNVWPANWINANVIKIFPIDGMLISNKKVPTKTKKIDLNHIHSGGIAFSKKFCRVLRPGKSLCKFFKIFIQQYSTTAKYPPKKIDKVI